MIDDEHKNRLYFYTIHSNKKKKKKQQNLSNEIYIKLTSNDVSSKHFNVHSLSESFVSHRKLNVSKSTSQNG